MRIRLITCCSMVLVLLHAPLAAKTEDYAAWKKANADGSWTRAAEQAVRDTTLANQVPADIASFCPAYASRNAEQRTQFWAGLMSAMARPESNFKPKTSYVEKEIYDSSKQNVISRGLLQISIESANGRAYACGIKNAEDLHQVDVNLRCGARILSHWVKKDGRITEDGRNRGGGRYWSVLRVPRGHLDEIAGFTKALAVCRP